MSYSSEVLADSPAAYYRCQEASGLLQDSSGNARHVTAEAAGGSVTYQQASPIATDPSDFSIDTLDHWFSSPDGAWFDLADVFTLEMWCKRDGGIGSTQVLFSKGNNSWLLHFNAGNQFFLDRQGVANIVGSTTTITDTTTWHHLVCTKTGATVKLYIDAVDVTGTVTNSTFTNTTVASFVGARDDANFLLSAHIDEVAIYPTALSLTRVQAHFDAATETETEILGPGDDPPIGLLGRGAGW